MRDLPADGLSPQNDRSQLINCRGLGTSWKLHFNSGTLPPLGGRRSSPSSQKPLGRPPTTSLIPLFSSRARSTSLPTSPQTARRLWWTSATRVVHNNRQWCGCGRQCLHHLRTARPGSTCQGGWC